jgi:hypothetical protein
MHLISVEEAQYRFEFVRRQQSQARLMTVIALCTSAVFALSALSRARAIGTWPLIIGIVLLVGVIAGAAALAWRNWRCPRCARPLLGNWRMLSCRRCGLLLV